MIKGGKVLDPDLFNDEGTVYQMMKAQEKDNSDDDNDPHNSDNESDPDNSDNDNDPDNRDIYPDNSDEDNVQDDNVVELRFNERKKSFEDSKSEKNLPGPIKTIKKSSRELNRLSSSKGFVSEVEKPSTNQSESTRSKRTIKSKKTFEPNFEPTYSRNKATIMIEEEDDGYPGGVLCTQYRSTGHSTHFVFCAN
jgi:hypothetical protein